MNFLTDEQRKILRRKKRALKGFTDGIEYYSTENIRETGANWFFVFGERSNGKSFAVKNEVIIRDAIKGMPEHEGEQKCRFMYVRRYSEDVTPAAVLQWLSDMVSTPKGWKKSVIETLSEGRYNDFVIIRKKIYAVYRDEDGNLTEDRYHIGYYINIGDAERIKSQSFPDVKNLVFEEFIATSKPYLKNEPALLENIVSTIARRDMINVWCIGNNNIRDNMYFRYFGLTNTLRQKEGTIDVYEKENGKDEDGNPSYIKIAVEFCPDNVNSMPGMFFGKGLRGVSGAYDAERQPKMTMDELEGLEELYTIFVEFHEIKYMCTLFMNKEETGYFWFVKPWNRRTPNEARVVSDIISTDPMTTAGFIPIYKSENRFFELLKNGKVFFTDDLTGTEFKRACKFFFSNNFYEEG